jgi:microcystin-dependent protein
MASTYTTRTRLEKQGDGDNANTWGLKLNQNVIDLVDDAVAGYETVSVDAVTSISLTANDGTPDQARNLALRFTGALTAPCTVVAPNAEKVYFVGNETTGNHPVVLKAGSASETVYPNSPTLVAFDGTNSMQLSGFAPGTRIPFENNAAPVGWTAVTDSAHNGAALRIVNAATSGAQVGGSNEFTSVFNSDITVSVQGNTGTTALTGITAQTTLTISQIPAHSHSITLRDPSDTQTAYNAGSSDDVVVGSDNTSSTGGGQGHSHSIQGKSPHTHTVSITDSFNLNVKYVNFIVCEKD